MANMEILKTFFVEAHRLVFTKLAQIITSSFFAYTTFLLKICPLRNLNPIYCGDQRYLFINSPMLPIACKCFIKIGFESEMCQHRPLNWSLSQHFQVVNIHVYNCLIKKGKKRFIPPLAKRFWQEYEAFNWSSTSIPLINEVCSTCIGQVSTFSLTASFLGGTMVIGMQGKSTGKR